MPVIDSSTAQEQPCDLCGLPCGRHPYLQPIGGQERYFCCLGCMNVYVILTESGALADGQDARDTPLFKRSLEMGLIAQGERSRPPAEARAVLSPAAGSAESLFHVSGMWCSSCAWLIEHSVAKLPGVLAAQASFASDTVKVIYQPQHLPAERIISRINGLGYHAQPQTEENENADAERRDLLVRTGLAFFLWLNIMTFSLAIYVSYFEQVAQSVRHYLPFLLMVLATPVVFYCAQPILRLAWRGLLHGTLRMETLLALGILSAYGYSVVQAFRGETHVYFDTASAIVAFVLAGKAIERGAKERTTRWLTQLHSLLPTKARLLVEGEERFVSIEALQPGQLFVVKAGERIPADGIVVEGEAHADESLLTGESTPIAKRPGSTVVAGAISSDGVLHIRAARARADSTISQIIQLVEKALNGRSDVERVVDRVSRIFVPAVVLVALATLAFCWAGGTVGAGQSLMRAITVLVIACPCALGLATPLAITAAIGTASRHGILVSDSRVMEILGKVDTVVLDKTGTVTEGRFALLHHHLCSGPLSEAVPVGSAASAASGEDSCAPAVAVAAAREEQWSEALGRLMAIESYSEHPLGKALHESAGSRFPRYQASEVTIHKGEGITGKVEGLETFAGNRRLVQRVQAPIDTHSEQLAQQWEREGKTVIFFGWDHHLQGVLAFGDRLRDEAHSLISQLQRRGLTVHLVSGDSRGATEWVASKLGVSSYRAECLPHEKIEVIRELQAGGLRVAMVGDGINDAPALAQSDLGIAMGSATDIAAKAAAVVLMDNSLSRMLDIFALAQKAMRIVRENLFWAFFYNMLGISLAITGVLNPILAAAAMLLSSLSVTGNSLRLTMHAHAR
ncbi:MAG: heavy metal translocating P-type ATPase [Terriglobales bacterium]